MSRDRSVNYRVRRFIGQSFIPMFRWLRRREVAQIDRELATFRTLCAEWHRLADLDHKNGVDFDAPDGAGHLAYERMEAECERLFAIPLPSKDRWHGYAHHGGLIGCVESYGALAGASSLHGWTEPFIPLTRRETYFVMGWKYSPPPTEQETTAWREVFEAMSRINADHYSEDITTEHGLKVHSMVMGKEYFEELGANLKEIEAEAHD